MVTMTNALTRLIRDEEGMTLVELLVVCALLPIVLGSGYLLMQTGTRMSNESDARQQATDQSRNVLAMLTTEYRQAVEVKDNGGAFAVALPRECQFYSDVEHVPAAPNVPELVRYRIVGTSLKRSVAYATSVSPQAPDGFTYNAFSAETTVATGVPTSWTGPAFTYYDAADPPAVVASADSENVSAVAIHLINSAVVGQNTVQVDLSTWVKIRSIHNSID